MKDPITLSSLLLMGAIAAALIVGVAFLVMFLMFFNLWLRAFVTRAGIGILRLVTMTKISTNSEEQVQNIWSSSWQKGKQPNMNS